MILRADPAADGDLFRDPAEHRGDPRNHSSFFDLGVGGSEEVDTLGQPQCFFVNVQKLADAILSTVRRSQVAFRGPRNGNCKKSSGNRGSKKSLRISLSNACRNFLRISSENPVLNLSIMVLKW